LGLIGESFARKTGLSAYIYRVDYFFLGKPYANSGKNKVIIMNFTATQVLPSETIKGDIL